RVEAHLRDLIEHCGRSEEGPWSEAVTLLARIIAGNPGRYLVLRSLSGCVQVSFVEAIASGDAVSALVPVRAIAGTAWFGDKQIARHACLLSVWFRCCLRPAFVVERTSCRGRPWRLLGRVVS